MKWLVSRDLSTVPAPTTNLGKVCQMQGILRRGSGAVILMLRAGTVKTLRKERAQWCHFLPFMDQVGISDSGYV